MDKNLPIDELIAINSLLIERESLLSDVSHIEATCSAILGEPYPFPATSATYPSQQKIKGKGKAFKSRKSTSKIPRIRRLKDSEVAYRVTVISGGQSSVREILDFAPLQEMLETPLPSARITKVETIDSDLKPLDTLLGQ